MDNCSSELFEKCNNTERSYECICQNGYYRSGSGFCMGMNIDIDDAAAQVYISHSDIDECSVGSICGSNADCINTVPGVTCDCHLGYTHFASNFSCEGELIQITNAAMIIFKIRY